MPDPAFLQHVIQIGDKCGQLGPFCCRGGAGGKGV